MRAKLLTCLHQIQPWGKTTLAPANSHSATRMALHYCLCVSSLYPSLFRIKGRDIAAQKKPPTKLQKYMKETEADKIREGVRDAVETDSNGVMDKRSSTRIKII